MSRISSTLSPRPRRTLGEAVVGLHFMNDDLRSLRDTKRLYRRLDGLLATIVAQPVGNRVIETYVERLLEEFSQDLKLRSAFVYRELRSSFVLEQRFGEADGVAPDTLSSSAPWVAGVFEQRVLFFEGEHSPPLRVPAELTRVCPAAVVTIEEPRQRHLLLFTFHPNWHREYAEFALNTARSALIARLFEQRLGGTLREAAAIQESLLPSQPPAFREYDIAGSSRAAEEVGGDFFDFLPLDEETMGLSVGDASGHGLPAALVARDVVVALRMGVERELKLRHTMRKLNRVVHSSNLSSGFVSLFYSELEANGNLFFVNAGHEPPLLVSAGEDHWLPRGGPVLGPLPDTEFKSHFVHIDRQATLVLYTDGIIERRNRDGSFLGRDGLSAAVHATLGRSSQHVVDGIFEAAEAFGHGAQWEDDATIVVVRRLPLAKTPARSVGESVQRESGARGIRPDATP